MYDHWERGKETQTSWGLILFHLLQSQTGRLRQAYQSTSPSTSSFTMHALNHCIWDFLDYFLNSIYKRCLVRGRHEDGVWKSLPAGHYSQKSKERWAGERKEESGMGVTPGSLTTVKSDKKKKIYWKNYLKILAGNKINKLFDSGFKIGTQWIKHWSHNYLEQGLPTFFYKSHF